MLPFSTRGGGNCGNFGDIKGQRVLVGDLQVEPKHLSFVLFLVDSLGAIMGCPRNLKTIPAQRCGNAQTHRF